MAEHPRLVCVGRITGAHGIKGMVKIFSHAVDPKTLTDRGPLFDATGQRRFVLAKTQQQGKSLLAAIEGITDRNAAEALQNTDLYLPRDCLPPLPEGRFYYTDIIGLFALAPDGRRLGTVTALHNYGAGDILEIQPEAGESFMISFSAVPASGISMAEKTLTIEKPEEI